MPDAPRAILVATDLSSGSAAALRAATTLARRVKAALHVVHVVPPSAIPDWAGDRAEREERERAEEARKRLGLHLRDTVPDSGFASMDVRVERPFRGIQERARQVDADLVVVGRHRTAMADAVLGTTADRVLRTLEVPCLVVPGNQATGLREPAVAIDLSEPARDALDLAIRWTGAGLFAAEAGEPPHRLDAVHVAAPDDAAVRMGWRPEEDLRAEVRREAEDALERTGVDDSVDLRIRLEHAEHPVDGLLAVRAGVLVMGTHGHGMMQRALVGSVSSAVVRRTEGAVLLVPPRLRDRRSEGEAS